jgi:phosphoribosylamine---glycine ligase
MNILVLGAGGREHALGFKLQQSPLCNHLYFAPGNAGTQNLGTNLNIPVNNFEQLAQACLQNQIKMLVVGPEDPLVNGIYDYFAANPTTQHIYVIGPSAHAAQLEGSKAFAKQFMQRHNIPTAAYQEFTAQNFEAGLAYIATHPLPIVLKADGLAAGKGVVICNTTADALAEFTQMIQESKFGAASSKVVIEEFLDGIELSIFALTDGTNYVLLPEAKDYKRIGAGDTGLNTGGMGTVSPLPFVTPSFLQKIETQIIQPTINGFKKEGFVYKGFVFFGLIKVANQPLVIEYNCRLGDPETQTILTRLQTDLVELLIAAAENTIAQKTVTIAPTAVATIVAVSGGYPGNYNKGIPINGLQNIISTNQNKIYHCGTANNNGQVVTNGGRVLAATATGINISQAVANAQQSLASISFTGMYHRPDIGYEFT